jgi:hypothetical protein
MALETGRTFSPTAGKGKNYVGLIHLEILRQNPLEQQELIY